MKQTWIQFLPKSLRSKIEERDNLQKIISNFSWLFADRILRMGVGLFVSVWVARYLGSQQFGLYNYTMAFVGLFAPLASLGLDSIVVREIVREPLRKNEILGTAFGLKLLSGLLTICVTTATIIILRPGDILSRWLVGIMATGYILQAFYTIDFWFQSQIQSKNTILAKNIAFIVSTILKVFLIQTQASLIAFVWLGLIEVGLSALGLVFSYQFNKHNLLNWRIDISLAKNILKESFPLILSGFAVLIYMKIDQIMLGEMLGDESVGIYSAAVKISEIWYFIPMAISSSITPAIINARKVNQKDYYLKMQKLLNLMVVITYVLSIIITCFSSVIISSLYGENYLNASPILSIHIWASIFAFLAVVKDIYIVVESMTKVSFFITALGALVNVILNFYLIPIYQELGAAIATVIAYSIPGYFICLIYSPLQPIGKLMTNALFLNWIFRKA
jgi:polysaccharide transporter, PST family